MQLGIQKPSGPSPSSLDPLSCVLALFFIFSVLLQIDPSRAWKNHGTSNSCLVSSFGSYWTNFGEELFSVLAWFMPFRVVEGVGWSPLIGSKDCLVWGKECSLDKGLSPGEG